MEKKLAQNSIESLNQRESITLDLVYPECNICRSYARLLIENQLYKKRKKIIELYKIHLEKDHRFKENVKKISKIIGMLATYDKRRSRSK